MRAEIERLREEIRRLSEEMRRTSEAMSALSQESQRTVSLTVYGNLDVSRYRGEKSLFDAEVFELVLSGHPHKRLSFLAQVELERAAGVGGERGGEVVVEQAYATYGVGSLLNLRAGVMFVPFGYVGVDHFPPRREVVSRPLTSTVVVPGDWTDNGLSLHGKQPVGESWLAGYEIAVVAGLDDQLSAFGLREARQGYGVDNNDDKAIVGRLSLNKTGDLQVGLSGYRGKYDGDGRRRLQGFAIDAQARLGPLKLAGEYDSLNAARAPEPDAHWRGYYVRLVYDLGHAFLPRTVLGREFVDPRLALVVQYDHVSLDGPVSTSHAVNRERRYTAAVNYRPSTLWVLKLAYEASTASAQPLVGGDRRGWLGSVAFVF
jgi:hypothetical protein